MRTAAPLGVGLSALTIACSDPTSPGTSVPVAATGARVAATSIQCDPDNAGLTLPAGFCALAVVKNVGRARHMAVRPNGDLYVAIDNSPGTTDGGILALRDADGAGARKSSSGSVTSAETASPGVRASCTSHLTIE